EANAQVSTGEHQEGQSKTAPTAQPTTAAPTAAAPTAAAPTAAAPTAEPTTAAPTTAAPTTAAPTAAAPTTPSPDDEEKSSAGEPSEKKKKKKKKNAFYRYVESIFGYPDSPHEPRFIVYPVVAYAPETSWEFGLSGLYVYYARDNPKNRLSEINAFAFITLEAQYGAVTEHAIYTDKDQWFFLGKERFQNFPLFYYGIGPGTPKDYQAQVDEVSLLLRERVLYKLIPSLYIGAEFSLDYLTKVKFNWAEGVEPNLPRGAEGSLNIGLGAGIVYDSRHNVLNTRDGLFSELAVLHSNPAWGSDYAFTTVQSDTRFFYPINARDTLAAQLYGNFTFGDVPFNELATLGGESLLRGYYLGRFRDRNFIGTQIEYRFLPFPFKNRFARRFGAALFAATGAVFPEKSLPKFSDFVVAGGLGLRFLLFPDKDIYTRGDLAFTKEGTAFYLFIGEAF
ncbi:MAG: outer membrane protein assembly factor, partial [Polyangiaceae bacterium]|nr:outer membrane protein assembly factor [Polyangiaceae bacterium]